MATLGQYNPNRPATLDAAVKDVRGVVFVWWTIGRGSKAVSIFDAALCARVL